MPMRVGGCNMAVRENYTLTDIPGELGLKIITQIRASEKPNRDEMTKKVQDLKLQILAEKMHEQK